LARSVAAPKAASVCQPIPQCGWLWSYSTHQQNGQHCGSEKGSHGTANPATMGTADKSTCQT
jgi:hypothetical protein